MGLPRFVITGLSVLLFLALWQAGAVIAGDPAILPPPTQVGAALWTETTAGPLLSHLAATLGRVAVSFAIAMGIGAAIGIAMGLARGVDAWADPWLVLFLNLPALVTIALLYIWVGLNEVAAILAVAVNKIPLVAAMMREGARALDPGLDRMASAYGFGWRRRMAHVVLPQLAPHLASAGRAGLALIWKIVLVVEFLGRPNGVGFQIHLYFQLFDVTRVLVYAVSFIAVMLAIEKLVLQPWERHAARWRGA